MARHYDRQTRHLFPKDAEGNTHTIIEYELGEQFRSSEGVTNVRESTFHELPDGTPVVRIAKGKYRIMRADGKIDVTLEDPNAS